MVSWSDISAVYETNKTAIITIGASVIGVAFLCKLYKKTSSFNKQAECPKNVVILYQVPPSNATPNSSQFCLKLETFSRIAQIPYQTVYGLQMSSKGKAPWIQYNGENVADSNFCVRYMNKVFNIDLDSHLSEAEQAIARSFQVMLEENTYWTVTYYRFVDNFQQYSWEVFKGLPGPLRWYISRQAQKAALGNLCSQGIGRHSQDEVYTIAQNDVKALSDFLKQKKYFMGDKVSSVDAVVFAFVANMVWGDVESPHNQYIMSNPGFENLLQYAERMKKEFYPDWDNLIAHNE